MGGKISHDKKDKSKIEFDFILCQVCKTNNATEIYTKCGHIGLCKDCINIILENTTCYIKCPNCNNKN